MTLDEYLRWCGTVGSAQLTVEKDRDGGVILQLDVRNGKHFDRASATGDPRFGGGFIVNRVKHMMRLIDNQIQERLLPTNGADECPP